MVRIVDFLCDAIESFGGGYYHPFAKIIAQNSA